MSNLKIDYKEISETIIVIGASTGGTEAIQKILLKLPSIIPPILIVQYMLPGFSKGFAERLNRICSFQVKEAENNEIIKSGCVYIAPDGKQMALKKVFHQLRVNLSDDPPENLFKPSVDFLFRSLLELKEQHRIAVLLTGMGNDGARELLSLKRDGVLTIVQEKSTCAVYGMPRVAIDIGAAKEIKRIEEIPEVLIRNILRGAA